jgi:hypothetical protein
MSIYTLILVRAAEEAAKELEKCESISGLFRFILEPPPMLDLLPTAL